MLKAISRLIDFVTWMISFLLVARFLMQFFKARASAPFVGWLYSTTEDLMSPFSGIFPNVVLDSGHVVEVSAIVGAIIYAVLGYALSAFLDSIADHLAYRPKPREEQVMRSPNPVPPSVEQKSINQPIDPVK